MFSFCRIYFILLFFALNLFSNEIKKEKIALLTFDDGPLKPTLNIINVIKDENIPITMFFIGQQVELFDNIYRQALAVPNITIGNHTYSHANNKYIKFYSNPALVVEDIIKADSVLPPDRKSKTLFAHIPVRLAGRNVYRLPKLSKNDNMIKEKFRKIEQIGYDAIYRKGFYIYGWDLEWSYGKNGMPTQTPLEVFESMEKVYERNLDDTNKVVLLMHDFMFKDSFNGKENLKSLISLLRDNGWKFQSIESY